MSKHLTQEEFDRISAEEKRHDELLTKSHNIVLDGLTEICKRLDNSMTKEEARNLGEYWLSTIEYNYHTDKYDYIYNT